MFLSFYQQLVAPKSVVCDRVQLRSRRSGRILGLQSEQRTRWYDAGLDKNPFMVSSHLEGSQYIASNSNALFMQIPCKPKRNQQGLKHPHNMPMTLK